MDGLFDHVLVVFEAATRCLGCPDLVLCSEPTFDMFIVGRFIARRLRRQLVLDYRDEWKECSFHFVRKGRFARVWEQRCLARTAAMRRHPELAERLCLRFIGNKISPALTEPDTFPHQQMLQQLRDHVSRSQAPTLIVESIVLLLLSSLHSGNAIGRASCLII